MNYINKIKKEGIKWVYILPLIIEVLN
jgi:hypothetical protein